MPSESLLGIAGDISASTCTELYSGKWVHTTYSGCGCKPDRQGWYDHNEVLRSYSSLVSEIEDLQEGLLVENRARFGEIKDETPIVEMALPVTGRAWMNKSYNFVIALGLGKCELKNLASDMTAVGIAPVDGSALILDEQFGGAICMPC